MNPSFTFKVLVAGPFGVGKTTLIKNVSSVPTVGTEVRTSGAEARVKDSTTVGMEYGIFRIDDPDCSIELVLFGTPGQERFSHMRSIAANGMDGFLLLVDATAPRTWPQARAIATELLEAGPVAHVVGLNRWAADRPVADSVRDTLAVTATTPIVPCDVLDSASARSLLATLLVEVEQYGQESSLFSLGGAANDVR